MLYVYVYQKKVIKNWISGIKKAVRVPVLSAGRLDAVAMWFDLVVDTENVIHTSPNSQSCWEQAIFPLGKYINILYGVK